MKPTSFLLLFTLLLSASSRILHDSSAHHDIAIANVLNNTNITNLQGGNWVLGNLTLNDYYMQRFKITAAQNTALCPLATPYVLKGKTICEQCPIATPIFSLDSASCVPCAAGEVFSQQAKQCQDPKAAHANPNPNNKSAIPTSTLLADTKNYTNISNLIGSNWVLGSLTLEQYYAKRFNISTHASTALCPPETPYVLKGKTICEQCPITTPLFSLQTDTCIPCPAGENFNNIANLCYDPKAAPVVSPPQEAPVEGGTLADTTNFANITSLDAGNWVLGNLTLQEYYQKRFNITVSQNTVQCPYQTPYVLKGKKDCQQCPKTTPVFSLQNDTCIPCPTGETFSDTAQQCQNSSATPPPPQVLPVKSLDGQILADTKNFSNITNLDGKGWVLGNINLEQYYKKRFEITTHKNTTLCPKETPFVLANSTNCQQCPIDKPMFSLQKDTCIGCPKEQIYNATSKQCQNKNATVPATNPNLDPDAVLANTINYANITNLNGRGWVLGNITLEDYYQKRFNITTIVNTSLCPVDTPFVLAGKKDCAPCPTSTPIFSLQNDTCIGCPKDQIFNTTSKTCQQKNMTFPPTSNSTAPVTLVDAKNYANISNLDEGNWILGNITIEQYYAMRFDITTHQNSSQCSKETPYVMAGSAGCQQCPPDKPIFVLENSTCIHCPEKTQFDDVSHTCKQITPNNTQPTNNDSKVNSGTPTPNNTSPSNQTQPINKTKPTNQTQPNNQTQPSNQTQPNDNTTKPAANTTTPVNPPSNPINQTTSPTKNGTKVISPTPSPKPNTTEPTQPFEDIDFCNEFKQCEAGNYFDYDSSSCLPCDLGQYFDSTYQTCLFCSEETPLLDSNFTCKSCPLGKKIDRTLNKCL